MPCLIRMFLVGIVSLAALLALVILAVLLQDILVAHHIAQPFLFVFSALVLVVVAIAFRFCRK